MEIVKSVQNMKDLKEMGTNADLIHAQKGKRLI